MQQGGPGRTLEDLHRLPRANLRSLNRTVREEHSRLAPDRSRWNKLKSYFNVRVFKWIATYFKHRFGKKPRLDAWKEGQTGVFRLAASADAPPDEMETASQADIRVSLFADWATGTAEAAAVADGIRSFSPHFTIHLGDIYYVGSERETKENCFELVRWPMGSVGSFALSGNHEMYARGEGYFNELLPRLGIAPGSDQHIQQQTSFFLLENEFWRIIGLDTGYNSVGIPLLEKIAKPSHKLPKEQMAWLDSVLADPAEDSRGTVLLSHHQYVSAFEGKHTNAGKQLKPYIDRAALWFWGHEHRLSAYGKNAAKGGIEAYGRCIGHGGMPVEKLKQKPKGGSRLAFYDNRKKGEFGAKFLGIFNRTVVYGYNGFSNLTFSGPRLAVEYVDLEGTPLVVENWRVDSVSGELVGQGVARKPLPPGQEEGPYRLVTPNLPLMQR